MTAVIPSCRKCKVEMKPGFALVPSVVAHEDFGGDKGGYGTTRSEGPSDGKPVPVWKCPKCGRSIT